MKKNIILLILAIVFNLNNNINAMLPFVDLGVNLTVVSSHNKSHPSSNRIDNITHLTSNSLSIRGLQFGGYLVFFKNLDLPIDLGLVYELEYKSKTKFFDHSVALHIIDIPVNLRLPIIQKFISLYYSIGISYMNILNFSQYNNIFKYKHDFLFKNAIALGVSAFFMDLYIKIGVDSSINGIIESFKSIKKVTSTPIFFRNSSLYLSLGFEF